MKRISTLVLSLALMIGCGLPEQEAVEGSHLPEHSRQALTSDVEPPPVSPEVTPPTSQPTEDVTGSSSKTPGSDGSSAHCNSYDCYGSCMKEHHNNKPYCWSRCC